MRVIPLPHAPAPCHPRKCRGHQECGCCFLRFFSFWLTFLWFFFLVLGFGFFGSQCPVSSTQYPVPNSQFPAPSRQSPVTSHQPPGSSQLASCLSSWLVCMPSNFSMPIICTSPAYLFSSGLNLWIPAAAALFCLDNLLAGILVTIWIGMKGSSSSGSRPRLPWRPSRPKH